MDTAPPLTLGIPRSRVRGLTEGVFMKHFKICLVAALALGLACGDDDGGTDSGMVDAGPDTAMPDGGDDDAGDDDAGMDDAGMDDAGDDDAGDDDAGADDAGMDAGPSMASMQIESARGMADGVIDVLIEGAIVTFVRPAVETSPAGFFLQGDAGGPAISIDIDPTTLDPVPEVGDTVTLRITEIGTIFGARVATMISDYARSDTGFDVSTFTQDLTDADDVVTALDDYEAELVSLTATIADDFGGAGTGHSAANIDTAGVSGSTDLRVRMPTTLLTTLQTDSELETGCVITFTGPMWRFNDTAQPSAYFDTDITVDSCPAPTVTGAMATSETSVDVTFDRMLDDTSVMGDGSQFTFSDGLTASAASVSGNVVTVTTASQDESIEYTVTVADTVLDLVGTGVDSGANTAMFMGFPSSLTIMAVDYPVIAHGAQLVISGSNFTGTTGVTVGGTAQTFTEDSDSQITIAALDESTPTGAQDIVVTTASDTSPAFSVTVIHLTINEVDADTTGTDDAEFIEISTGISGDVSLAGYVVVLFNGSDDQSYSAIDLDATATGGLLLIAPTGFSPAPAIEFGAATNNVQNGADAVTIYQGAAADFPNDTAISTTGLIDAVAYDTADGDDAGLLDGFFGSGAPEAVQIDEDETDADLNSVTRCGTARIDGRAWDVLTPTPGAANSGCP